MTAVDAHASPLQRLDDQIAWYAARAASNQRNYHFASMLEIVIASSIVVIASMTQWHTSPPLPALLGAALAIIKGMETTLQWQANWTTYRASAEALLHKKIFVLRQRRPIRGPNRTPTSPCRADRSDYLE
ncbi:MAG: hypothetical protein NVSMB64_14420 [Candidatus Velthaea sp.]